MLKMLVHLQLPGPFSQPASIELIVIGIIITIIITITISSS